MSNSLLPRRPRVRAAAVEAERRQPAPGRASDSLPRPRQGCAAMTTVPDDWSSAGRAEARGRRLRSHRSVDHVAASARRRVVVVRKVGHCRSIEEWARGNLQSVTLPGRWSISSERAVVPGGLEHRVEDGHRIRNSSHDLSDDDQDFCSPTFAIGGDGVGRYEVTDGRDNWVVRQSGTNDGENGVHNREDIVPDLLVGVTVDEPLKVPVQLAYATSGVADTCHGQSG